MMTKTKAKMMTKTKTKTKTNMMTKTTRKTKTMLYGRAMQADGRVNFFLTNLKSAIVHVGINTYS